MSRPLVIPLDRIEEGDRPSVGGKSYALARLLGHGVRVPRGVCFTTDAYEQYVSHSGLRERILLELNRKPFEDMRWEEVWDTSLRIRNLFLTTALPAELEAEFRAELAQAFRGKAVVVRSSALGEDSGSTSFAGLHESFVNINTIDSILEHIRLVWASLWSDRALLYRKELNLDVIRSAMATVVQVIVEGERSGIAFGVNPLDASQAVVEAVHGLNQGLVDGTIEPDRWILDRKTATVLSHAPAVREKAVVAVSGGITTLELPSDRKQAPPLTEHEVNAVYDLALGAEQLFGAPQDVEWTYRRGALYCLQSRPITKRQDDERAWYLSLHRNLEELKVLRRRIEDDLLPAMDAEARELAAVDLAPLSDARLVAEITRRKEIKQKWVDAYWRDCIPFAHGMRLFGQVYNDAVRPRDPHEFMDVLAGTAMLAVERNRTLERMAALLRRGPTLLDGDESNAELEEALDRFLERFGSMIGSGMPRERQKATLRSVVAQMGDRPPAGERRPHSREELTAGFLSHFEGEDRSRADELVDLARASYRLRDEDNLYLGRIEAELVRAAQEVMKRLEARQGEEESPFDREDLRGILEEATAAGDPTAHRQGESAVRARQLVGQPAGPGMADGVARVVFREEDLFAVKAGEILVCDAVSPTMTVVVPLVGGIIERRGGMLIHGAIIAREYGIPCVTGVPEAVAVIQTGDHLFVDGYLGIVRVDRVC